MDKIDLDAIIANSSRFSIFGGNGAIHKDLKSMLREAIHQALVLTRKNAKIERGTNSVAGDGVFNIQNLVITGILDVEKLIV